MAADGQMVPGDAVARSPTDIVFVAGDRSWTDPSLTPLAFSGNAS